MTKKIEKWEEKFNELGELYSFPFASVNSVMGYKFEECGMNSPIEGRCDTELIKSFIRHLLSIQKEELDHDHEILVNTILETKNQELKALERDFIQGILDDTAETNEDVWTGVEIREYLKEKLKTYD